jgi:glutaredoxin 3
MTQLQFNRPAPYHKRVVRIRRQPIFQRRLSMTDEKIEIFGQDLCPYTSGAREDFRRRKIKFYYINVLEDTAGLERMLKITNGRRSIPVIVEAGKVTIGFGGT